MTDMINPAHYRGDRKFEPIEVIEDWDLNYRLGNALKYISRNGRKPGEDPCEGLRRAIWYLEREIQSVESTELTDVDYEDVVKYYAESTDLNEAWPPEEQPDYVSGWNALSKEEIEDILAHKALDKFHKDEIVATVEKRGFILGLKKDGTTCELRNGKCV